MFIPPRAADLLRLITILIVTASASDGEGARGRHCFEQGAAHGDESAHKAERAPHRSDL